MSSQIRNDPRKLRDFADSLNAHAKYWDTSLKALQTYTARLGQSWQDDEYTVFCTELKSITRSMSEFREKTIGVSRHLEQDAEKLEAAQRIKT